MRNARPKPGSGRVRRSLRQSSANSSDRIARQGPWAEHLPRNISFRSLPYNATYSDRCHAACHERSTDREPSAMTSFGPRFANKAVPTHRLAYAIVNSFLPDAEPCRLGAGGRVSHGRGTMRFLSKPERFWSEINKVKGSAVPYVLRRTPGLRPDRIPGHARARSTRRFRTSPSRWPPTRCWASRWAPCWSCGPMPGTSGGGRAASSGAGSSTSAETW